MLANAIGKFDQRNMSLRCDMSFFEAKAIIAFGLDTCCSMSRTRSNMIKKVILLLLLLLPNLYLDTLSHKRTTCVCCMCI